MTIVELIGLALAGSALTRAALASRGLVQQTFEQIVRRRLERELLRERIGAARRVYVERMNALNAKPTVKPRGEVIEVHFRRSGKTCRWDPGAPSLLEFAEENGIELASRCRSGECGACLTTTKGAVKYVRNPKHPVEAGTCLPCIAVPAGRLEVDA